MKRDDLRQALIDGTIDVIAQEGLDKATTKQVGSRTHTNEAYIYRCFNSKEDMFTKTFDFLDFELINTIMHNIDVMVQYPQSPKRTIPLPMIRKIKQQMKMRIMKQLQSNRLKIPVFKLKMIKQFGILILKLKFLRFPMRTASGLSQ